MSPNNCSANQTFFTVNVFLSRYCKTPPQTSNLILKSFVWYVIINKYRNFFHKTIKSRYFPCLLKKSNGEALNLFVKLLNALKTNKGKKTTAIAGIALIIAVVIIAFNFCLHDYSEEIPKGKSEKGYLFVKTCQKCYCEKKTYYKSMLTFIDDDAKTEAMLHWENIIDATGIKMTSAIIPSKINDTTDYDSWTSYAGWDLLKRLADKGVEYVNHTYNHKRLTTFTEEEMHEDFKKSKEIMEKHNIDTNILVYPFYNHDVNVERIASAYFDAAFSGKSDFVTEENYHRFAIKRMNINDSELTKEITFSDGRTVECLGVKSLKKLKRDMKKAINDDGWLVYVVHAYDSPTGKYYFDEESEASIIEFCKYVQKRKDVKIVTATEGFLAMQAIS